MNEKFNEFSEKVASSALFLTTKEASLFADALTAVIEETSTDELTTKTADDLCFQAAQLCDTYTKLEGKNARQ